MSGENTEAGQVAPVEGNEAAPTEAVPTNAAPTDSATGAEEGGEQSQGKEKTFTQAELDEILQKRIAKAEARAERRVLKTLEKLQPPQQRQEAAPIDDGKPKPREGETNDSYIDRLTDWKLEQRERQQTQQRQQQQQAELARKTETFYAEAQKVAGFDREVFDDLPLTRPIAETLMESSIAPQLMAYMSANPEEVERIAGLSPARQMAELGRLEARLEANPQPVKRVSSAPAPLNPIKGKAAAAPTYDTTDPRAAKELSTAEWIRRENERQRKRLEAKYR